MSDSDEIDVREPGMSTSANASIAAADRQRPRSGDVDGEAKEGSERGDHAHGPTTSSRDLDGSGPSGADRATAADVDDAAAAAKSTAARRNNNTISFV
jgi:hypothetical protein